MSMEEKVCVQCGKPKAIYGFAPADWRNKRPRCSACKTAYNRNRRVRNPVPADPHYGFNSRIGEEQ